MNNTIIRMKISNVLHKKGYTREWRSCSRVCCEIVPEHQTERKEMEILKVWRHRSQIPKFQSPSSRSYRQRDGRDRGEDINSKIIITENIFPELKITNVILF